MEPNGNTAPGPYCVPNLNDHKEPNLEMVKQEAPESVDIPLELFEHQVHTIKSETVTTDDKFIPIRLSILNSEIISDQPLVIKQELLHEELNIKTENEAIQGTCFNDKHNGGNQLSNYMKFSSKLKCFKCNICDYSCNHKGHFKSHLRTHTGERPFKCNICDYSTARDRTLKSHLRIHTGEKPLKCNMCEIDFRENRNLENHLMIHTGEKPFKCHFCDYRCIQKGNLKSHLRTHSDPFKCNVCNNTFKHKSSLNRHMIIHSGE